MEHIYHAPTLQRAASMIGALLYGTQRRTTVTLCIAFALVLLRVYAAARTSHGFCPA